MDEKARGTKINNSPMGFLEILEFKHRQAAERQERRRGGKTRKGK
ncbi:MAG: hypothetical protein QMC81_04465 [Thermoanaerobacterales bacterium]|nr:hypothetical protein [Bacillota bacterium]MDI6906730.1 hypothetical protein [Thermoanaerobacterales bacterium]